MEMISRNTIHMENVGVKIGKILYRDYHTRVIMISILIDKIKDPELCDDMLILDVEMNRLCAFIDGETDYIGERLNLISRK